MDLDLIFKALGDRTRRRIMDELAERDGQTLFELNVRLISWYGAAITRQALSKHLGVLEAAGLIRTSWEWRSKRHFLERQPVREAWQRWLRRYGEPSREDAENEDPADQRLR